MYIDIDGREIILEYGKEVYKHCDCGEELCYTKNSDINFTFYYNKGWFDHCTDIVAGTCRDCGIQTVFKY